MLLSRALLSLGLSLSVVGGGAAADTPFTVISVKSLDEILKDARRVTGTPRGEKGSPLDTFLARFGGPTGLPGIDSTKPFGLCVTPRGGSDFAAQLLIPLKDHKAFLGLLGIPESVAQGSDGRIFAVQFFGTPLYARTSRGYCAISNRKSDVESSSSTSWLGAGSHDISLQCNPGQLPLELRRELAEKLMSRLDSANSQSMGIAGTMRSARGQGLESALKNWHNIANGYRGNQLRRVLEDCEKFFVGVTLEAGNGLITFDHETTARAGTQLAREYNSLAKLSPAFSGLLSNEAAVSISLSVPMPEEFLNLLRETLGQGYQLAQAEVDKSPVFSSVDARANAHDSLGALALAFEGLKELNFAFLLSTSTTGKPQVATAMKVASGKELSRAFQGWARFPPAAFEPGEFKLNVAQHSGVPIHRLTVPPTVGEPFGGTSIHMTVRGNSAFFALGSDSLAIVRTSLEKTATAATRRPPVSLRLIPSKLLGIFPGQSSREEKLLKAFRGSGDYITYEMLPAKDGTKGRLTLGEGVLRAITEGINGQQTR